MNRASATDRLRVLLNASTATPLLYAASTQGRRIELAVDMKTPSTSAYYKEASQYVEQFHGTRAANYIEEGEEERRILKAQLLDEYVDLCERLRKMEEDLPAITAHAKIHVHFYQ